jgi:hypothetical protein
MGHATSLEDLRALAFYHKFLDVQHFISFHYELLCKELFAAGMVSGKRRDERTFRPKPAGCHILSAAQKENTMKSDPQ